MKRTVLKWTNNGDGTWAGPFEDQLEKPSPASSAGHIFGKPDPIVPQRHGFYGVFEATERQLRRGLERSRE